MGTQIIGHELLLVDDEGVSIRGRVRLDLDAVVGVEGPLEATAIRWVCRPRAASAVAS
jgi:hypothetical protein